jgi:hypothetical protein
MGSFFQSANLWEVGTYLLVRHHLGAPLCDSLKRQQDYYESVELAKDRAKQDMLQTPNMAPAPDTDADTGQPLAGVCEQTGTDTGPVTTDDYPIRHENQQYENQFMQYLHNLHKSGADDIEEEVRESPIINEYLPKHIPPTASYVPALPFIGTYLRVVHTNGIHDIAMVNCECRGQIMVVEDLLAAHLLPSSFQHIRTLFTVNVLDSFRLSNLELKASAYQFYQLLRRLTMPMAPADVVDLYREFRRMSRLWHWMKRLKWVGRGIDDKSVREVKPGELGIYCPACPQPGINIPDDWKDDEARHIPIQWSNAYLNLLDFTVGCTNVYLLQMVTLRPTMYGKRKRQVMFGFQRVEG